jgi:hypothetical protein
MPQLFRRELGAKLRDDILDYQQLAEVYEAQVQHVEEKYLAIAAQPPLFMQYVAAKPLPPAKTPIATESKEEISTKPVFTREWVLPRCGGLGFALSKSPAPATTPVGAQPKPSWMPKPSVPSVPTVGTQATATAAVAIANNDNGVLDKSQSESSNEEVRRRRPDAKPLQLLELPAG